MKHSITYYFVVILAVVLLLVAVASASVNVEEWKDGLRDAEQVPPPPTALGERPAFSCRVLPFLRPPSLG